MIDRLDPLEHDAHVVQDLGPLLTRPWSQVEASVRALVDPESEATSLALKEALAAALQRLDQRESDMQKVEERAKGWETWCHNVTAHAMAEVRNMRRALEARTALFPEVRQPCDECDGKGYELDDDCGDGEDGDEGGRIDCHVCHGHGDFLWGWSYDQLDSCTECHSEEDVPVCEHNSEEGEWYCLKCSIVHRAAWLKDGQWPLPPYAWVLASFKGNHDRAMAVWQEILMTQSPEPAVDSLVGRWKQKFDETGKIIQRLQDEVNQKRQQQQAGAEAAYGRGVQAGIDKCIAESESFSDALDSLIDVGSDVHVPGRWLVHLFAQSFSRYLSSADATNFLEINFVVDDSPPFPFRLTVQRVDGKSPHQLLTEARAERDRALEKEPHLVLALATLRSLMDDVGRVVDNMDGPPEENAARMLAWMKANQHLQTTRRAYLHSLESLLATVPASATV